MSVHPDVLIFSKDRACQLDLLLRSISRHAPELYRTVSVLYDWTEPCYAAGYQQCLSDHAPVGVRFVPEIAFQEQTLTWLARREGAVSFLCDDDVFYRYLEPVGELPWSLRGGDYDYPFSLDGNIYERSDVDGLLDGLPFTNPTTLEAVGHEHRFRLPFDRLQHGAPCLTGIPWNRVSVDSRMPHLSSDDSCTGVHQFDLNERYLEGFRLPVPTLDEDLPAHTVNPIVLSPPTLLRSL